MSFKYTLIGLTPLILAGCNVAEKLSEVGDAPEMSRIQDPTLADGYQTVSMPMPDPSRPYKKVNSLWESGARAFFKDQRANKVGDILTVNVELDEKATFDSKNALNRNSTNQSGVTNFLGYENKLKNIFPKGMNPASMINYASNPSLQGNGKYERSEKMKIKIATTIIQILPNGNMMIHGRQEVRLYNEVRLVDLEGIVRREDITSGNSINFDKVAEARISYGGRGDISDMQNFPVAQQVLNKVSPW